MCSCLNNLRSQKSIRNFFFAHPLVAVNAEKNETWIPLLQCALHEIYSDALICVVYFIVLIGALCGVCCEVNSFDQEFPLFQKNRF
jgi:hypothetical protein